MTIHELYTPEYLTSRDLFQLDSIVLFTRFDATEWAGTYRGMTREETQQMARNSHQVAMDELHRRALEYEKEKRK